MQLTYNGVTLHTLGELHVGGEKSTLVGGEMTRRRVVQVPVRLDFFHHSWAANRAKVDAVRTALADPLATLLWVDETTGTTILNRPATLVSHDLPEDPNQWGTHHQSVSLIFSYDDTAFSPSALLLTLTPYGGSEVDFGEVMDVKSRYQGSRYSPLHDERSRAGGIVQFRGQVKADASDSIDDRREYLIDRLAELRTAANAKNGALRYGNATRVPIEETVRVTEFDADINQLVTAIEWTLSAEYTEFPNEGGAYALADFTLRTRIDRVSTGKILTLSGRVVADSLATADTKIAALIAALIPGGAVRTGSIDRDEARVDGPDGAAWLEVRFDETFRTIPDLLLLTVTPFGGSEVDFGEVIDMKSRYQGSRYSPFHDQRSRAGGVVSFRGQIQADDTDSLDDRREYLIDRLLELRGAANAKNGALRYGNATRVPIEETVRISEFDADINQAVTAIVWSLTAEYTEFPDEGATYALAEFTLRTRIERVGSAKTLTLSGKVVADSLSSATTKIAALRTALIPGGAVPSGQAEQDEQRLDGPDGAAWLEVRFDEAWRVPQDASMVSVALRVETETDWMTLRRTSTISGRVSALNRTQGEAVVTLLFAADIFSTASIGKLTKEHRSEDREKFVGDSGSTADDIPSSADTSAESYAGLLTEWNFSKTFEGTVSGDGAVIETEVSEEIVFSTTRWVNRPTAYGRDVMQACGISPGRRTIRGSVVAPTEALCVSWGRRQWYLPFSGASGMPSTPGVRYALPPTQSFKPAFIPRTDGIARTGGGTDYNPLTAAVKVQVWRMDFSFEEILPEYDYV